MDIKAQDLMLMITPKYDLIKLDVDKDKHGNVRTKLTGYLSPNEVVEATGWTYDTAVYSFLSATLGALGEKLAD